VLQGFFGPGVRRNACGYREIAQPVIIPGDMGAYSYLLFGTDQTVNDKFATTCYGAGRALSRRFATGQGSIRWRR
jgi:tRNA-splicing ligase RtcB